MLCRVIVLLRTENHKEESSPIPACTRINNCAYSCTLSLQMYLYHFYLCLSHLYLSHLYLYLSIAIYHTSYQTYTYMWYSIIYMIYVTNMYNLWSYILCFTYQIIHISYHTYMIYIICDLYLSVMKMCVYIYRERDRDRLREREKSERWCDREVLIEYQNQRQKIKFYRIFFILFNGLWLCHYYW